jgi:hypothetical protein
MPAPSSATAAPTTPVRPPTFWLLLVHAAAIWAFAVAQPLYDVLRRNTEFFIAHRSGLGDLVVFCLLVSAVLPAVVATALAVWTWWRPSWRLGTAAVVCGALLAVLGSQLLAHRVALPTTAHGLLAGLAGLSGGWLYYARRTFRSLLTAMSPAIAIFPLVFLLQPSLATFVRTETRDEQAAADIPADAPPIVFLVFDQLPLTSLMDSHGGIDRDRYPGFAALADTSTWYRNASTVADFTGWALPPIVSGQRPSPERRPTSASYPFNLFTWLGSRYHIEGFEPITQLCPERLCDARRPSLLSRVVGMITDSSVVYLAIVLPEGPRQSLPSLTNDWKNFIQNERWQRRWVAESKGDRRAPPQELIAGISRDDPAPTLYFGHTLLPHEPYVYLRSGQQFADTGTMVGHRERGLWSPDPWPVTLAYTQHLMQVEFVDALVARMLDRLKTEGLLERALIVVTSDHGVSFRPGRPFKGLHTETIADMAAVPLFIKAPGQTVGRVSDRNVQSIDVMPTIASLLGVPLTWTPDGIDAGSSAPAPPDKRLHYTGASKSMDFAATWLAGEREKAVARKVALFGENPGWRAPAPADRQLLRQSTADLPVEDNGDALALVELPQRFRAIPADAAELPVAIDGRLRDGAGNARSGQVAIAVGGRIVALTRTFDGRDAPRDSWRAILDPSALAPGANVLDVFVIPDAPGKPLTRAFTSGRRPDSLNLASRGAADYFEVAQNGFFAREGEPVPARWTSEEATIDLPTDDPPRTLRVGILETRPGGSDLAVTFNDCPIFKGPITAPWYRVFPLDTCPPASVTSGRARIVIRSPVWRQEGTGRSVGVAVETVNLFSHDWPPPDRRGAPDRASIRVIGSADTPRPVGATVRLDIANLGSRTWLPASETTDPQRIVWLALRWRTPGSRETRAEERVPLPRALYPTDRIVIEAQLVPPDALKSEGPWEVTIAPIEHDGSLVAENAQVEVPVTPRAAER